MAKVSPEQQIKKLTQQLANSVSKIYKLDKRHNRHVELIKLLHEECLSLGGGGLTGLTDNSKPADMKGKDVPPEALKCPVRGCDA